MCLEDVTLGRRTHANVLSFTLSTSSKSIIGASFARRQLQILPPSSGVVWVSPQPVTVAGQGYCLTPADPPLKLLVDQDGQAVTYQWSAIADAGAPILVVIETILLQGSEKF